MSQVLPGAPELEELELTVVVPPPPPLDEVTPLPPTPEDDAVGEELVLPPAAVVLLEAWAPPRPLPVEPTLVLVASPEELEVVTPPVPPDEDAVGDPDEVGFEVLPELVDPLPVRPLSPTKPWAHANGVKINSEARASAAAGLCDKEATA